jgi:multidrug resistance efflux pump
MEVHGKIDEADVGQLKVGQTAQFTVDAYPDRIFTGQVLQIRKAPRQGSQDSEPGPTLSTKRLPAK